MDDTKTTPRDIDDYIAGFPEDVQTILRKIRSTIRQAVPGAEETIKYQMPTFTLNGNLIHFGAFKHHIGLYPVPRAADEFKERLATIEGEKSTARFPFDKPVPFELIGEIVKFNAERNLRKSGTKKR